MLVKRLGFQTLLLIAATVLAAGIVRAEPCDIHLSALGAEYCKPGDFLELRGTWGDSQEGMVARMTRRGKPSRGGGSWRLPVVSWTPTIVTVRLPQGLRAGKYGVAIFCSPNENGASRISGWLTFRVKDDLWLERLAESFDNGIGRLWLGFMAVMVFLMGWSILFRSSARRRAAEQAISPVQAQPPDGREAALRFLSSSGLLQRILNIRSRSQSRERKYAHRNNRSVGWFVTGCALVMMAYIGSTIIAGYMSSSWPWTEDSRVNFLRICGQVSNSQANLPLVEYEYRIGGLSYTSTRIDFGLKGRRSCYGSEKSAPYKLGRPVRVYYHPRYPALSVLVTGIPVRRGMGPVGTHIVPVALALVFLFIGLFFLRRASQFTSGEHHQATLDPLIQTKRQSDER